jgi:hypothetical protein
MGRPPIPRAERERIYQLRADGATPTAITATLALELPARDPPVHRETVRRYVAAFDAMPTEQRAAYRGLHWPQDFGEGPRTLPYDHGRAFVLLTEERRRRGVAGTPTGTQVKWGHRLLLARPDLPEVAGWRFYDLAMYLAATNGDPANFVSPGVFEEVLLDPEAAGNIAVMLPRSGARDWIEGMYGTRVSPALAAMYADVRAERPAQREAEQRAQARGQASDPAARDTPEGATQAEDFPAPQG